MAKKKAQEEQVESIVSPEIRVAGETHPLEDLIYGEGEEAPIMKAVGYMRLNTKVQNNYISYVVTFQGDKVLKIEVGEPNLKAIAEETAKIAFVNNFIDSEE